jgi:hypothetical protein
MDSTIQSYFEDLQAEDKDLQYEGFNQIMAATQEKMGWAMRFGINYCMI